MMNASAQFVADVVVQLGMFRMNWRFSRLVVSSAELRVETPLGTFLFAPGDVVEIKRRSHLLRLLAERIEIRHTKFNDLGSPLFLWSGFPRVDLAAGIAQIGFVPQAKEPVPWTPERTK